MAKIVKIPLIMKNGEKATDMKSLIANFDVESVVGYFLDGKLEKWLNDRYYEEEAEAIAKIEKDDPMLAKQLCEIFGVEYEAVEEIDAEEIARRNGRIARLKQLTDDEEVLQNVDAVAFDQEELAELYDNGVQKIYLCEGEFRIPKSKQHLDYVLIGAASSKDLPVKNNVVEETIYLNPCCSASDIKIPERIADKIAMNHYVCLDDYVVYFENWGLIGNAMLCALSKIGRAQTKEKEGFFKVWNKTNGEESSFDITDYDSIDAAESSGNQLILHNSRKDGLLLYDVTSKKKTVICTDYSDRSGFSVSKKMIAYTDKEGCLLIYDIGSKKKLQVAELGYSGSGHKFIMCEEKLLYHNTKDNTFCAFDVETKTHKNLFSMSYHLIMQTVTHNTRVYIFVYHVFDDYVALLSFDLVNLEDKPVEHLRFDVENSFGLERLKQVAPYFIYVKREYKFPVYVFNMDTNEMDQVASECGHIYREEGGLFKKASTTYFANDFQVVGDYLYFIRGESEICRINLYNPDEASKIIE